MNNVAARTVVDLEQTPARDVTNQSLVKSFPTYARRQEAANPHIPFAWTGQTT